MTSSAPSLLRWFEDEELRSEGELWRLSQEIWTQPELKFQEHKAHQILTDFLEEKGFRVQRNYILPTAFKAELDFTSGDVQSSGPTLALLCEYDALPGIGHACGHNLIAEVGVAAALALKRAKLNGEINTGKLLVLGTPAEEDGGGKIRLLKEGAFKNVDAVLMSHPYHGPQRHASSITITALKVELKFLGRAAHASGQPWQGLNALDAAVNCYVSVALLKQNLKPNSKINGVITEGGHVANVIPHQSSMQFFIRAPTTKECEDLLSRFRKCVTAAADVTGCEAQVDVQWDKYYIDIKQNKAIEDRFRFHTEALGVKYIPDEVLNASTDFGNVSHVIPGLHAFFGLGTGFFPHTAGFADRAGSREAQEQVLSVAAAMASTVADLFKDSQHLEKARKQHEEMTQSEIKD